MTTNFGFLIDNRKCIGCHACSTACKSENTVPVGVNRTWVKYTEKGVFPETRRYFQVTRCNHCANPPCVHICPTGAMYQRRNGIVEFNRDACIGCKACLQACPYDAIYIDPDNHTAAKCHFCAHRLAVGLEPACVVVCPEHAILAGDLNDPRSEIARALATQPVRVRKPEQGTQPKLFYIDAEEASIVPTLASQAGGMLWATRPDPAAGDWRGPIQVEAGSLAGALMRSAAAPRETYNVPHRIPWHWQVPTYLVTKALGAGAFLIAALGTALGLLPSVAFFTLLAPLLALVGIGLTTGLLVWDLDRPERFWTILIRPQWRSWLARGAVILIGFTAVAGLYFLAQALGFAVLAGWLAWPGVVLAGLAAVYTAFLFAQAEGRDLWQSALLPWHMLLQSILAGAAGLLIVAALAGGAFAPPPEAVRGLAWVLGLSLFASLLLTVGGEFGVRHASQVAATAAHLITHGPYRRWYWASLLVGLCLPLLIVLLTPSSRPLLALAGVLAVAGLFAYEWAFVMAPQQVPNN
ncbi:MAG: polysulfide reductase NrfD [Anaerolineales bacterium]|nr:polysulfide reductase NrfD [Anaerolineales bacterium]